jgi:hypothetical protein
MLPDLMGMRDSECVVRGVRATKGGVPAMEQQTVEVRFQGELVGSCVWDDAGTAYTLYRVPGDVYVVHVTRQEESFLATNEGQGFTGEQIRRSFPHVAVATGMGPAEILVIAP